MKWNKGITRINILMREYDPIKAIKAAEEMGLPKHRVIGYEVRHYKGKDGFWGVPEVFIER